MKPGWRRVKFGDVVRLNKETSKDPLADGLDRYVGLEHIEPGDLRIRSWGDIADGTTFTNRFRPGQVLFGKRRAYQRKVAVADFGGVCSGDIYVFEPKDPGVLLPELLPFICQTDAFFDYAVGTSAGSLSPRTNWKSLAEYEFVLPSMEAQERVARMLAIALNAYESHAEAARKAHTAIYSYLHNRFYLASLADSSLYPWQPMGSVLSLLKDGDHYPPKGSSPDGPMLLSVSHISEDALHFGPDERRIPWKHFYKLHEKWSIRPGDSLLCVIGATLGKVARVPAGMPPFTFQRMVAVLRANQQIIEQDYLHLYLQSSEFQRRCWSVSRSTAQPAIYLQDIARLPVPIAPKDTQKEVVGVVKELRGAREIARARSVDSYEVMRCIISEAMS
ncbi:restriction endonuclease subunit S [Thiohalocapsa sp. ML1]|uniref:restriction endonuclease subunit S n=1 Tax=Thiohalocapsa sp. ML1 TaxID=1431688 RepID=UPI0009EBF6B7|nr:restriction endonuclease subunit S [Thiohalocapsa sp. ML1]